MQKDDFDIRVFPNLERFCNADMQKPLRYVLPPKKYSGLSETAE